MPNIDQIFLYMKDEIEKEAKKEEQVILKQVEALEKEAYEAMRAEAKRDAELQLQQQEIQMKAQAQAEISKSHTFKTKRLIEKRQAYVNDIFTQAKERLMAFVDSPDYQPFMMKKAKALSQDFGDHHLIVYLRSKDMTLKDELVKVFTQDIDVQVDDTIIIGGMIVEDEQSSVIEDASLDFALTTQKEWFNKHSGFMIR